MPLPDLIAGADAYAAQAAIDEALLLPIAQNPRDDLIAVLAASLSRFLLLSPFEPWRRNFAVGAVELTCLLNGYELALSDTERVALLDESDRPTADRARLEEWLRARIRPLAPAEAAGARIRARQQLGPPYLDRPRLYIATAFRGTSPRLRSHLSRVAGEIQDLAEEVAGRMAITALELSGIEDADGQPLEGRIAVDAPWREEDWREASESCAYNRGRLRRTSVLIVLGGSHSTGTEVVLTPVDAPVLFLACGEQPLPHAVDGNLALRLTHDERIKDWGEAAPYARTFLEDVWADIERAWRMAELRGLIYQPIADELAARFAEHDEEEIAARLTSCGLVPDMRKELCDPHAIAQIGLEPMNRVAAAFAVPPAAGIGRGVRPELSERQREALEVYFDEFELTIEAKRSLRREAERRLALGTLRHSLTAWPQWRAFHRELIEGEER